MSLFPHIVRPLGIWAYLAIAGFVIVEGPIATLLGAVAAAAGFLKPDLVFAAAAAGNLTSDTLWYLLGYLGKIEWVEKYGRWFGLTHRQVADLQATIQKNALRIIFIAKLTMGFMIPVLIATGLTRVPIRRWFPVLFLGECIWTGSLILIGMRFGRYLSTLEHGLQLIALGGALVFVILIIQFFVRQRSRAAQDELS